jgi:D-alanyl-D-alanine carboxypeptidase
MKKHFLYLLLALSYGSSYGQNFNPNLAAKLQFKLDSLVTVFSYNTKGISASVFCPGQGIWQGASGVSYTGKTLTPDMQMGLASNSKLFTAVTLLLMAEDSILSLEDSLSKWIPNYTNVNPNITIRQLLNHTSGVSDPFFTTGLLDTVQKYPTRVYTPQEVLTWLGPKAFDPGKGYQYSNINYILAGMVAKSATGKDISTLIRNYILTPLHMDSTFYDIVEPVNGILAHRHHQMLDIDSISRISLNTSGGPAGSLFSTVGDMAKWYQALMNGEVLSEKSFAELTNFVSSGNYGLGIQKTVFYNRTTWGHAGSTVGYKTRIVYDPGMKIFVCCLANDDYSALDGITVLLYKFLIENLPTPANPISGITEVCQGTNGVTYTTPIIPNATSYHWTFPIGASGTSTTNTINIEYGIYAQSGKITVSGNNTYGPGAPSQLMVLVNDKPGKPDISLVGNSLHSSATTGNQWFDENGLISGAQNQDYTPSKTGTYSVLTTNGKCISDTSEKFKFTFTGTEELKSNTGFKMYPNPTQKELIIEFENTSKGASIQIYTLQGRLVQTEIAQAITTIETSQLPKGMYLLKVEQGPITWVRKFVKED